MPDLLIGLGALWEDNAVRYGCVSITGAEFAKIPVRFS